MRSAIIAGFSSMAGSGTEYSISGTPTSTWGMEATGERKAMMQLSVSQRITTNAGGRARAGFEDATAAMEQLV